MRVDLATRRLAGGFVWFTPLIMGGRYGGWQIQWVADTDVVESVKFE